MPLFFVLLLYQVGVKEAIVVFLCKLFERTHDFNVENKQPFAA